MEEEFLRNLVIDRCRKTFHYILKLILLLLQENILSKNISFESPSKVLKTDIETSRLGLVFCLQINQFYRASKLMRQPVCNQSTIASMEDGITWWYHYKGEKAYFCTSS